MFLLLIVLLAFWWVTQFTPSFFLHLLRNHNSAPKKTSRFPYCPCIIIEILISANIGFSGIAILSKRKSIHSRCCKKKVILPHQRLTLLFYNIILQHLINQMFYPSILYIKIIYYPLSHYHQQHRQPPPPQPTTTATVTAHSPQPTTTIRSTQIAAKKKKKTHN